MQRELLIAALSATQLWLTGAARGCVDPVGPQPSRTTHPPPSEGAIVARHHVTHQHASAAKRAQTAVLVVESTI
jgi:hypothetical protein